MLQQQLLFRERWDVRVRGRLRLSPLRSPVSDWYGPDELAGAQVPASLPYGCT